jgi:predicted nuclease of predicted toxin-antitoxin system
LKFLLDVNIGTTIAQALQNCGYDVVRAAISYPTWADAALLDLAVRESRIIVTEDSDFTDLIFSFGHRAPPSLIYIRREPETQRSFVDRILEVMLSERLRDHIVVLTPAATRYRPFPTTDEDHD